MYIQSGKDIARNGGQGDNRLLLYVGLLNPPDQ